jgi:hypothetical protein
MTKQASHFAVLFSLEDVLFSIFTSVICSLFYLLIIFHLIIILEHHGNDEDHTSNPDNKIVRLPIYKTQTEQMIKIGFALNTDSFQIRNKISEYVPLFFSSLNI